MKKVSRNRIAQTPYLDTSLNNVDILYTPSPVDEFYFEEIVTSDGSIALNISDPIYLLFNQDRINKLGSTAINQWLESLNKTSSYNELKSKCSDADLISMIKSRHIQSASELKSWLDYCSENIEYFNTTLEQLQKESKTPVEPSKTE